MVSDFLGIAYEGDWVIQPGVPSEGRTYQTMYVERTTHGLSVQETEREALADAERRAME